MVPTNDTDPTGLAAVIIGALTPMIALLALVLHWTTDLSNAVLLVVTGVVEGVIGILAVLRARKHAYAPATVRQQIERTVDAANVVRPDLPPPV